MSANSDGLPKDVDAIPFRELSSQQLGARMARWMDKKSVTLRGDTIAEDFNEMDALLSECRRRGWV